MFNRLNNTSPMLSRPSAVGAVGARERQHCPLATGSKPTPVLHVPRCAGRTEPRHWICSSEGGASFRKVLKT
jgi:hypothetical protein